MRVLKYPLRTVESVVEMPRYARVLHVGTQRNGPVLWALVDEAWPPEERTFHVYGTGEPVVIDNLVYLGTCQTESGLVWHVFEKPIDRNIGEVLMDAAMPERAAQR